MNNSITIIAKKELDRFIGDRRMVVSILLPGIFVYILYSIVGTAMGDAFGVSEDYIPSIQAVSLPDSIRMMTQTEGLLVTEIAPNEVDAAKEDLINQAVDVLMLFPEDFDQEVDNYEVSSGFPAPNIEVGYNSASTNSVSAYRTVLKLLDAYESRMVNKFDINAGGDGDYATAEDRAASFFAMMLPMVLMLVLYSGCSIVAPESIAGEKERGTFATMLITPIRRSDIAMGKILALAIISMICATSSTVGTVLSLPKMMSGLADRVNTDIYGAQEYLLLAIVILVTVLVLVTLISILSAFAKTIKEAQTYTTSVMVLLMGLGVTALFGSEASQELSVYCIPLYNSVQCMKGVLSFSVLPVGIAVTVGVNLTVTLLGVFVLAKMFNSEKIIFSK